MKKIVFAILVLFLLATIGITADKAVEVKADVKKEVVAEKKVLTESDWKSIRETATSLDNEGKFEEACTAYLQYIELGEQVKNDYSISRKGWGYNNAAYCIIKMHKQDRKVDLNRAKVLLDKGLELEVGDECAKCMDSNMAYVNFWLGTKTEVKKEMKIVTPEAKKDKK